MLLVNFPEIYVGELFSLKIFLISPSHTVTVTGHFDMGRFSGVVKEALFILARFFHKT